MDGLQACYHGSQKLGERQTVEKDSGTRVREHCNIAVFHIKVSNMRFDICFLGMIGKEGDEDGHEDKEGADVQSAKPCT